MAKLDVKAFGIALGLVVGAFILLSGIFNLLFCWESGLSKAMEMICFGYTPTLFGVVMSTIWGFIHGFVIGAIISWLYNRVVEENKADINRKIKEVARSIWESKGRPSNSSADDWREAEKRVRGL